MNTKTNPADLTEEAIDREIEALRARVWTEREQSNMRVKVMCGQIAALWLCKKNLGRAASH